MDTHATMDTTGKDLVDFWAMAGDKGIVPQNTATARKIACSQILGVADGWEKLDVSKLNIDEAFRRFANKRGKDFTPASLGTYKSRFNAAISEFLKYAKNPSGFKPSSQRVGARKEKGAATRNGDGARETPAEVQQPPRAGLIEYPFPLREGRFAYLRLPVDLKMADVKRLTAYLNTLAEDAEVA